MAGPSPLNKQFCKKMNEYLRGGAVKLACGPTQSPIASIDCTFSEGDVRVLMSGSIQDWMAAIDWSAVEAEVKAQRMAEIQQAWERMCAQENVSLNSMAREVVYPLRAFGGGAKNLTKEKIQVSVWSDFKLEARHVEAAFGGEVRDALMSSHRTEWYSLEAVRNTAGELKVIVPEPQGLVVEPPAASGNANRDPEPSEAVALEVPPLNLLLEGVPGVGKTYRIDTIVSEIGADHVRGNGAGEYAITMHPATTYEEFVEGLRPTLSGETRDARNKGWCTEKRGRTPVVKAKQRGSADLEDLPVGQAWFWKDHGTPPTDAKFVLEDGFFLRVCAQAVHFPDHYFVVLLDEFNRCNIPKVLGDLLTSLESSKRARWTGKFWDVSDCPRPTLPASKRLFFVPDNVIVVATMNTSDRSVGGLDAALRRRFAFERIWPHGFDPHAPQTAAAVLGTILGKDRKDASKLSGKPLGSLETSVNVWHALNTRLKDIGPDALLGHSYLYDLRKALENTAADAANRDRRFALGSPDQALKHVWLYQLLPQLCEILDVNHQQRIDDLAPYNEMLAPLGLGVRLAPPSGRSVHGAVHITRTP